MAEECVSVVLRDVSAVSGGVQGHLLKCRVLWFGSHKVYRADLLALCG